MYRKILTLKNILIILCLILSILTLFNSCSYAWTFDEFIYYCQIVANDTNAPTNFRNKAQLILDNEQGFRNNLGNSTYTNWVVDSSSVYLKFQVHNGTLTLNSNQLNDMISFNNASFREYYKNSSGNFGNGNDAGQTYFTYNTYFGLLDLNEDYIFPSNAWFNNRYIPPYTGPTFTPLNNGKIIVYNSLGTSELMNRLPFTYTGERYWTLGYLSDFSDVYQIHGYFGPMVYTSGELFTESYQNTFLYDKYYGVNNNNLIFDSSTGLISISRNSLINKQGYNLYLSYTLSPTDYTEDIGDYNYYAYFYNLNLSSGDLVSPDLNSTIDISLINSLTDFFEISSGDYDTANYIIDKNIFDFTISGDLFSGDLANKLGYKDYFDNDYSGFIYSIYRNSLDVLSSLNTNTSISFSFRGHTYTFYSDDFSVPDGPLKSFVRLFLVAAVCYLVYLQVHNIILKINTLDLHGLLTSFDRDHTIFM